MGKKVITPSSHIASLVSAYLLKRPVVTNPNGSIDWCPLDKYKDFLLLSTNVQKAERIMEIYSKVKNPNGNNHFWFLVAFLASHRNAINNLITAHPWTDINLPQYCNFEKWRCKIENEIKKQKGIRNLVWYDVALILAYLLRQNLMPKDYVYVHALPLKVAIQVFAYLGMSKTSISQMNKNYMFPYSSAPTCLTPLNAYQMEDFFCCLGHAMKTYNVDITGVTPQMILSVI